MKRAIGLILTFIITLSLLCGALALTAKIPDAALYDNFVKSSESYKATAAFEIPKSGRLWGVSDNYADAILLGVAWNMGESGAIDTKYYDGGEQGINIGLYRSITKNAEANVDYTRYWHGNAGVVRVFHLFTDLGGMKTAGIVAIFALALFAAGLLCGMKCPRCAVCFILSLVLVGIWNVRLSLEYQPVFVIAMLMCILFLLLEKRGEGALAALSVAGGVATAFFDFLTCETLPILLPLVLVIAARTERGRGRMLRDNLRLIIICGLAFGAAYVLTFAAKWAIASLLAGENKLVLAASSAAERFAGESAGLLSGIPANLTVLFGGKKRIETALALVGVMLSAAVLLSAFYLRYKKKHDRDGIIALIILASVVFLRYAVLNNHSYLHEFFTYRALASTICALLCIVALCDKEKKI